MNPPFYSLNQIINMEFLTFRNCCGLRTDLMNSGEVGMGSAGSVAEGRSLNPLTPTNA